MIMIQIIDYRYNGEKGIVLGGLRHEVPPGERSLWGCLRGGQEERREGLRHETDPKEKTIAGAKGVPGYG